MASTISAGNATNGLAISSDNTGILQLKTGTGAGTTALTIDTSQNATFAGTVAASAGAIYPLVSGTAVTASGTAVDFTGIPSWVKRITVLFNGLSSNSASALLQVQLGTGATPTFTTSGYAGSAGAVAFTGGFGLTGVSNAAEAAQGAVVIYNTVGNTWTAAGSIGRSDTSQAYSNGGSVTLAAALTAIRITTTTGTATFDAGTVNIFWE